MTEPRSETVCTETWKAAGWTLGAYNQPIGILEPPQGSIVGDWKTLPTESVLGLDFLMESRFDEDAEDLADGLKARRRYLKRGIRGLTRYDNYRQRRLRGKL